MKTRKFLPKSILAIMLLSIGVFAASCINDDLYEYGNDLNNSSEYRNQEFLDLSDYSDLGHLSVRDQLILQEAEERMNIQFIDGLFKTRYNKGAEINVSDKLFDYIKDNYDHLNFLTEKTKTPQKTRRVKSNAPESSSPYAGEDCVPIAISHYCGISYEEAIAGLVGKHLTLIEAVRIFKPNATEKSKLELSSTGGILTLFGHVANLERVEISEYNGNTCYRVYYKDWQQYSSDGGNYYFLVSNLDFPCRNIYGSMSIIFGLVQ